MRLLMRLYVSLSSSPTILALAISSSEVSFDNIPPIHSGIGPVTALKLAKLSVEDLNKYLATKKCKDLYYNNKKLIDFEMIPSEYTDTFKKTYNFVIS